MLVHASCLTLDRPACLGGSNTKIPLPFFMEGGEVERGVSWKIYLVRIYIDPNVE